MDDEEIIREHQRGLLGALGHERRSPAREAALEQYQAAHGGGRPFDVVILDLTIRGGMGGTETMRGSGRSTPA